VPLASLDVDGSAEQDAGSDAEKVHGAIKVCTVEITERHRKQDQYLSAHAPIATRNQQLIDRFLDLPENHCGIDSSSCSLSARTGSTERN
jgi:hypothetical protein